MGREKWMSLHEQMLQECNSIFEALDFIKARSAPFDADIVPKSCVPTLARPGTKEKLSVMRKRAERGEDRRNAARERQTGSEASKGWQDGV